MVGVGQWKGTSAYTEIPFLFLHRAVRSTLFISPNSFLTLNHYFMQKTLEFRMSVSLCLEYKAPKLVKVKAHTRRIGGKVVKVRAYYRSVVGRKVVQAGNFR